MHKLTLKEKITNFTHYIWDSCKDWKTFILLLIVIAIVYFPVWGGYLLHSIFGWQWCFTTATICLAFWAGPFTPFFPVCIGMTLFIKNKLSKNPKYTVPEHIKTAKDPNKKVLYSDMFWLFLFGSVLGVVIEGLFCLITKGHWESHVVSICGWFNILYGAGAAGLYAGAVKLQDKPIWLRAVILMSIATVLELASGLLLKYGLGMKAWDYHNNFLNLDGIICLQFSLAWAAIAYIICALSPHLGRILTRLRNQKYHVFCMAMSVFLIINIGLTGVALERWSDRHYGLERQQNMLTRIIDYTTPDQWMQNRFVEGQFLDIAK